jgi:hypothetical protein
MLKVKEIKEIIAFELGGLMDKDGFIYKKTDNELVCRKGDYTYIFNMLITYWTTYYSLDIRLFINQKKIEDIYESIVGKSYKQTLGAEIGVIYSSPDGRKVTNNTLHLLLEKNEDIPVAINTLKEYYELIAMPYFERYSNLEVIDDIMNNPPFEHNPAHVGGTSANRYMKGLIVAKLVDNSSYENLVSTYDEAIKRTMDEDSIEAYHNVREYLMYNRIT